MFKISELKSSWETWKWLQGAKISLGTMMVSVVVAVTGSIGYFKYLAPLNDKVKYIPVLVQKVNKIDSLTSHINNQMLTSSDLVNITKNISDSLNAISHNINQMNYKINVIYQSSPELQQTLKQFLDIMESNNNLQNYSPIKPKQKKPTGNSQIFVTPYEK